MASKPTIFDRLLQMETERQSLHDLIVEACEVGNALIASLDPANVRKASQLLMGHGHGLHGGLLILMADAQDRALAAAHATNGDTPTNGARAA